jgi:hypothetical protein
MAIKRAKLVVGNQYKTKISQEWQQVTLASMRDDVPNSSGTDVDRKEVLVRTGAGNLIYRSPGQLRLP